MLPGLTVKKRLLSNNNGAEKPLEAEQKAQKSTEIGCHKCAAQPPSRQVLSTIGARLRYVVTARNNAGSRSDRRISRPIFARETEA